MYVRGNLGQDVTSFGVAAQLARVLEKVDQGLELTLEEAALYDAYMGVEPITTVTPSQQVSVPTAPVTGDLLEREVVAGTGIKVKHAVLAGGGIFLVAALAKKKR